MCCRLSNGLLAPWDRMYYWIRARFITERAWSIHQGYRQQLLNPFPRLGSRRFITGLLPEVTWFFCCEYMVWLAKPLSVKQYTLFTIVFFSGAGHFSQLALIWLLRNQILSWLCVYQSYCFSVLLLLFNIYGYDIIIIVCPLPTSLTSFRQSLPTGLQMLCEKKVQLSESTSVRYR